MDRCFTTEEISMASIHLKRWSVSFVIKKMHIKLTLHETKNLKKGKKLIKQKKSCKNLKQLILSYIGGENANSTITLKKSDINPAVGIYSRENKQTHLCCTKTGK